MLVCFSTASMIEVATYSDLTQQLEFIAGLLFFNALVFGVLIVAILILYYQQAKAEHNALSVDINVQTESTEEYEEFIKELHNKQESKGNNKKLDSNE